MKIGIDVRPVFKPNSRHRGIGRYTFHLVRALLERDSENEYLLYTLPGCAPDTFRQSQTRELKPLKIYRLHWALELLRLGYQLSPDKLDVFLATELVTIPAKADCQIWAVVHDLIPLIYWDEYVKTAPWDHVELMKVVFRRAARADRVITISEWAREDICERLEIPSESVHVIYPGRRLGFGIVDREEARTFVAGKYGLDNRFVLYVGGSDFRKNLPQLVRAFSVLRKEGYPGNLVLVGETFNLQIPEVRELRQVMRKEGVESAIVTPGFVSDEDLTLFYNATDALAMPSRCEGFGLPVLEGLQCGAPVVAARASAIPEVAGDEAVYFDLDDDRSLVRALRLVLEDAEYSRKLREAGPARATRFSWERSADDLRAVLALAKK